MENALGGFAAGTLVAAALLVGAGCTNACDKSDAIILPANAVIGSGIGALIPPRRSSWATVDLSTPER